MFLCRVNKNYANHYQILLLFSPIGQEYPFLQVSIRDFSIPACYLSLGSESCLNLPIIAKYSSTMFISATQFVTCHVNFMQNMKLTVSDVQEMSQ